MDAKARKLLEDLTAQEIEELLKQRREQEEAERREQLELIHAEQEKRKRRMEELEAELKQVRQELREFNQRAADLAQVKPPPVIRKLDPSTKLVDMITVALFEADRPMTAQEIHDEIAPQMKKAGKGGNNPLQSISSQLNTGSRFERLERGVHRLTDEAREQAAELLGSS